MLLLMMEGDAQDKVSLVLSKAQQHLITDFTWLTTRDVIPMM